MRLLASMVAVGGRQKPGEVGEGTGRVCLCAYVNLQTLDYQKQEIARSEGRKQVQRNKLRLAGALSF